MEAWFWESDKSVEQTGIINSIVEKTSVSQDIQASIIIAQLKGLNKLVWVIATCSAVCTLLSLITCHKRRDQQRIAKKAKKLVAEQNP